MGEQNEEQNMSVEPENSVLNLQWADEDHIDGDEIRKLTAKHDGSEWWNNRGKVKAV